MKDTVHRLPRSVGELSADIREGITFGFRYPSLAGRERTPKRSFASSLWTAPLVGLLLGLISLLIGWILWEITLSAWLSVFGILATMMILSGSVHEDGMADIADSWGVLGSGKAAVEQRLVVMKDPRLGVFGVQALLLSFVFRLFGMLTIFFSLGFSGVITGVITIVPLSRIGMVWLLYLLPSSRVGGFADIAGRPSIGVVGCCTLLGLLPAVLFWGLWAWIWVLALCLVTCIWFFLMKRTLGGVTGDGCGAVVVVTEVVLWLVFSVLARYEVTQGTFYQAFRVLGD